jgi:hypothetical protein
MPDSAQLRRLAAQMFAVAMTTKDHDFFERLCIRAGEYLDQASALETAQPSIANDPKPDWAASVDGIFHF